MRRIRWLGIVGLLVASSFAWSSVWASPFEWAPEDYQTWVSGYPYQRNIDLTFSVSPQGEPGNGIPGALYEGSADAVLLQSDFVQFTGDFQWYDSVADLPFQGLIGIDNRGGQGPKSGGLLIHLGNIPALTAQKRIWIEWDFVISNGNLPITFFVSDSLGHLPSQQWSSSIREVDGLMRQNVWLELVPNPLWEELSLQLLFVPVGQYALIDRFHVATECIPEPASGLLAAIGGLGLFWAGRRRLRYHKE